MVVSHDWPHRITQFGDAAALFRRKRWLQADAEKGQLGSPASWELLAALQPRYWFAGHLHAAFAAAVPHAAGGGVLAPGDGTAARVTRFLATDKPLPRRQYVQVRAGACFGEQGHVEYAALQVLPSHSCCSSAAAFRLSTVWIGPPPLAVWCPRVAAGPFLLL